MASAASAPPVMYICASFNSNPSTQRFAFRCTADYILRRPGNAV